jgi:DNA polymerase-4
MVAKKLLLEFWDANTPIRLIGIALTNVVRENELQVSALDNSVQKERARKLDKTIDSIRSQYGRSKIVRGVSYNSSLRVGKKYAAQIENKEKNK